MNRKNKQLPQRGLTSHITFVLPNFIGFKNNNNNNDDDDDDDNNNDNLDDDTFISIYCIVNNSMHITIVETYVQFLFHSYSKPIILRPYWH